MPRATQHPNQPVRLLRLALGGFGNLYSQEAFSQLVGIPVETIRSYEMGRLKVSMDSAIKISAATGVDPSLLLREECKPGFYTKESFDAYREILPEPEEASRFEALAHDFVTTALRASLSAKSGRATPDKYRSFCFALNKFLNDQVTALGLIEKFTAELQQHTTTKKPLRKIEKLKEWKDKLDRDHPDFARWQAKFDPAWRDDEDVEVEETQWRKPAPMAYYGQGIMVTRFEIVHVRQKACIHGKEFEYFNDDILTNSLTQRPISELFSMEDLKRIRVKSTEQTDSQLSPLAVPPKNTVPKPASPASKTVGKAFSGRPFIFPRKVSRRPEKP